MPKRFTDSEKWKDPWFRKLSPISKLLFLYVCDQCDLAGFWEIDLERASFDTGSPRRSLEGALEEVSRCYETNGTYLWITRFVQFQGNYPFKEKNRACLRIIDLFHQRESFSKNITRLLNGEGLISSFEGGNKVLFTSASNGIGKGQGIGKGISSLKEEAYSPDFEEFWGIFKELRRAEGKPLTWDHWNATLKGRNGATGHPAIPASAIIIAAMNYRDYCVANHTERRYVMQPASFVGPKKRGWEGYKEPVKTGTAERDERMVKWAEEE